MNDAEGQRAGRNGRDEVAGRSTDVEDGAAGTGDSGVSSGAGVASGAGVSSRAVSGGRGVPGGTAVSGGAGVTTASGGDPGAGEPSLLRQAVMAPNLLSVLRLAGVPVFLWLLLGPHADGWALAILVFSGLTDWLDGKLARWLNQMSRLGQVLDPAADRLYIVATLVAFLLRDIIPWWAVAALLLREAAGGVCLLILRHYRFEPPEVTYVGKGATFVLMYAFPLLLLVQGDSTAATIAAPLAYAFTIWGGALYLWSGALYVAQTVLAVTRGRDGTGAVRE